MGQHIVISNAICQLLHGVGAGGGGSGELQVVGIGAKVDPAFGGTLHIPCQPDAVKSGSVGAGEGTCLGGDLQNFVAGHDLAVNEMGQFHIIGGIFLKSYDSVGSTDRRPLDLHIFRRSANINPGLGATIHIPAQGDAVRGSTVAAVKGISQCRHRHHIRFCQIQNRTVSQQSSHGNLIIRFHLPVNYSKGIAGGTVVQLAVQVHPVSRCAVDGIPAHMEAGSAQVGNRHTLHSGRLFRLGWHFTNNITSDRNGTGYRVEGHGDSTGFCDIELIIAIFAAAAPPVVPGAVGDLQAVFSGLYLNIQMVNAILVGGHDVVRKGFLPAVKGTGNKVVTGFHSTADCANTAGVLMTGGSNALGVAVAALGAGVDGIPCGIASRRVNNRLITMLTIGNPYSFTAVVLQHVRSPSGIPGRIVGGSS